MELLNFSRGRKWNPLRQRLDSYDYTVKQHIVGSLLFTPLLLLLPTTSVFYIFFSILDTTINLIRILIGAMISVIHATPYVTIFLRLVKPRRFPYGIWFDIVSCRGDTNDSSNEASSRFEEMRRRKGTSKENSSFMVSFLHSNFMTPGETFRIPSLLGKTLSRLRIYHTHMYRSYNEWDIFNGFLNK